MIVVLRTACVFGGQLRVVSDVGRREGLERKGWVTQSEETREYGQAALRYISRREGSHPALHSVFVTGTSQS